MIEPGLYIGAVMHRRARPIRRRFEYRAFWLVLDLDTIEQATRGLKLLSVGRFNLFSFSVRDHADGRDGNLRHKIAALAADAGCRADGPIRLMTMPRVLGYVFNPLSVYFCHDARGSLTAIVWEVSNTFGGRHSYAIGVDDPDAKVVRQHCRKQLHVSPFIDMDIEYHFRAVQSPDALSLGIVDYDRDGVLMTAAMSARRRPLTDRELLAAFARMPFSTMKVIAAIHWEAVRLWLKGVRYRRPPPDGGKPVALHSASAHPAAARATSSPAARAPEQSAFAADGDNEPLKFERRPQSAGR